MLVFHPGDFASVVVAWAGFFFGKAVFGAHHVCHAAMMSLFHVMAGQVVVMGAHVLETPYMWDTTTTFVQDVK